MALQDCRLVHFSPVLHLLMYITDGQLERRTTPDTEMTPGQDWSAVQEQRLVLRLTARASSSLRAVCMEWSIVCMYDSDLVKQMMSGSGLQELSPEHCVPAVVL